LAFPWRVLEEFANRPAPPHEGDKWRVNFSRVEWQVRIENGKYVKVPKTPEDNWVWSPQGVIDMHRPEMWGYVQFVMAPPGKAKFVPDPEWPARALLHKVYWAQKAFYEKNRRWAKKLSAFPGVRLRAVSGGYEASVSHPSGKGRLAIREDSCILHIPGR
jgi:hypothetical protein